MDSAEPQSIESKPEGTATLSTIIPSLDAGAQRPAPGRRAEQSVGQRAATGAIWIFLAFAGAKVIGFSTDVVLARILAPADFGLVSFALIVINVFTLLQDLGVPAALIYSERDVEDVGGTALTINIGAAALLLGLAVLVSPILASLGGHSIIAPITIILAIGLVFSAAGSVQDASLSRALQFKRKSIADVASLVPEGAVAISMAFAGFGVWSLVGGYLAQTLTSTLLLWSLSPVRPRPMFNRAIAGELLGYGKHVSASSVVTFLINNVDYAIVGHYLGAAPLGIYTLAFMVANLPSTGIAQVVKVAAFPALARVKDDTDHLIRLFEDVFTIIWSLSIAIGLGIVICAPKYMSLILGPRWIAIEAPLRVLAVFAVFKVVGSVFPSAFKALGRPEVEWRLSIARLAVLVPSLLFAVRYGLVGVAVAQVMVAFVFVPLNAFAFVHLVVVPRGWLSRLLAPHAIAFVAASVTVLVGYASARLWLPELPLVGPLVLFVVALGTYAVVLFSIDRRMYVLLRAESRRLLR